MNIAELYKIFRSCSGVTTDSRTLKGGELFFALKGENFDGNEYALKALESGAAYAVVNASSEEGMLAVNGMSYSKRDSENANSAIIVSVTPEDFEDNHPLSGIEFQRKLEKAAFDAGNGKIPVQTYGDFKVNRKSTEFTTVTLNGQ
mgnify:CR=1 FL=1